MSTSTVRPPQSRRAAPSQRNQQIYFDYQTTGRSQTDLAKEYKLTQCRISQIIRRVRAWLARGAGVPPATSSCPGSSLGTQCPEAPASSDPTLNFEPGTLNAADLDAALHRNYIDFVCRHAIREFQADRVTVTRKTGQRGDKPFDETTNRREPKSLQCLKILMQAIKLGSSSSTKSQTRNTKHQIPADEITPSDSSSLVPQCRPDDPFCIDASSDEMLRKKVGNWLVAERGKRQRQPDGNIDFDSYNAEDLVSSVLGEPAEGRALEILAADLGKILVPMGQASGWPESSLEQPSPLAQDSNPPASSNPHPAPDPSLPPDPDPSLPPSLSSSFHLSVLFRSCSR